MFNVHVISARDDNPTIALPEIVVRPGDEAKMREQSLAHAKAVIDQAKHFYSETATNQQVLDWLIGDLRIWANDPKRHADFDAAVERAKRNEPKS